MAMLKIGIMPREEFQKRILNIASGSYKPKKSEPKIWFHSIKSIGELLSENNVRLLKMIEKEKPESLKVLSELSGRQVSNLSRTLKKMAVHGIVKLEKHNRSIRPVAKATSFNIMYPT
ncbi:MAG: transcriptional regulator [gamma proteobacterium symbiont of Taylorina sp.]|nr:transcriptional regulator [gamma proteobacterium symbiont of Taylorina sp.]